MIAVHNSATHKYMKLKIWIFICIFPLFLIACGSGTNANYPYVLKTDAPDELVPNVSAITNAIHLTANKMIAMMQENGQFTYRFHLDESITYSPKYNMLRHAGAIYALNQYHEGFDKADAAQAIWDGSIYLKTCCLKAVSTTGTSAIWSLPRKKKRPTAKLGGAGLGLTAAAISFQNSDNNPFSLEEMRRLGDFILFMQKKDGGFYSKYFGDTDEQDDSWTSLYYPGEAALGLMFLYRIDPNPKWETAANRALLYLANSRKSETDIPHDHWALIATNMLLRYGKRISDNDRETHLTHVIQLCEAIMSQQISEINSPAYGAFDPWGKTTPAATRVEGLVAAYHVLPDSHDRLKRHIYEAIERSVAFLLRAQIKKGIHAGAFPRALLKMPKSEIDAEDFNRRKDEVRIDYLQHALSALLGWLDIQEKR